MLKFLIKLFAVFVFLIPLFFFVAKGSDPQPASADSCTFKAINTTGNTNEPVEVVITQASPFTTYKFTVSKGGTIIKSQDVGSGPIIAGGDVRYTFSGSNFTSTGNYVFFVSSPGGAGCSGFPFTVFLDIRFDPCTFKAINTTGDTDDPVEVIITQASPLITYTFTLSKDGKILKSQAVGSGPIIAGGDVKYTFSGSYFTQTGNYVIFVAAPGDFGCSGFPFTISISAPPPVSGNNPCVDGICKTALGQISTSIGPFASKVLAIGIGLAGGIALIIMVIGAIRVLTSAGDPKNVSAGREMIIAAVVGLLFLIFSIIILKFITTSTGLNWFVG